MVVYTSSLAEITPAKLQGFFVGWRWPLTPARHLEILERASNRVLAVDTDQDRAVGFITALSDGLQSAFITHFEVLPEYQAQGIGDELMRRMLEQLAEIANVDPPSSNRSTGASACDTARGWCFGASREGRVLRSPALRKRVTSRSRTPRAVTRERRPLWRRLVGR